MKVLIDIPQEMFNATQKYYSDNTTRLSIKTCIEKIASGTPIPDNSTNGDMIKAMFPYIKIHEHEKTDICDAHIQIDIWDFTIYVSKDWWDAPY